MPAKPRLLVTGSTGFLGHYVVRELLARGYERPLCLVRETSDLTPLSELGVEFRYGDLADRESLVRAMSDASGVLNLASLGFGHAPNIVGACQESGIGRGVFISTTAIFTSLEPATKAIRLAAETLIEQSPLAYTILRPTMIYGSRRDRNIWQLITYLRRYPAIPVFGTGRFLQQPVYVEDVARAAVDAFESSQAVRKSYNIAGADALTYNDVIDTVCAVLRKRVFKIHLPVGLSTTLVRLCRSVHPGIRLTVEQIHRLNEHKAFSFEPAQVDFGYFPLPFAEGVRREICEGGFQAYAEQPL